MRFVKLQGAGNDFILYDNRETGLSQEVLSKMAAGVCRRRVSLGADALIAVEAPKYGGDLGMTFFNCDGSLGEMCGNGARCLAKWAWEAGLFRGDSLAMETDAGVVLAWKVDDELYKIQLNSPSVLDLDRVFPLNGREYVASYVELGSPGVPHLVLDGDGLGRDGDGLGPLGSDRGGLRALAAGLRSHTGLPKGANVDFYRFRGGKVDLLTFERGVEDFTLACGTGAGATALVLVKKGLSPSPVTLECPGGVLRVDVEGEELFLTGPAVKVAEGEVYL